MKALLIVPATVLFCALSAHANHEPGHKAKAEMKAAIETACAQDAATAGCGDKKVGTGLMKCLHAYKKANKDYKFSDSCKETMKDAKEARKEHKAKKEEK